MEDSLEGILFLYSETGTEGGYWAFQDYRFVEKNTNRYACRHCGLYWDKEKSETQPPNPEPIGFCDPDDHSFELVSDENWSYEGLHILEDGDELIIYHPYTGDEVWKGMIDLKQHPLFTEDSRGLWIHADQKGIERDVWAEYFFKNYRAKLIRK